MASKGGGKVAGKGIAAATDAAARKADWDRDQFSARLNPSRKALLRELASTLPAGLSPVEVVDRAVEIALAKIAVEGRQAGSGLDIEGLLANSEAKMAGELRSLRSLMAQTVDEVRGLSELMSAVAAIPESTDAGEGRHEGATSLASPSIRAWLDARPGSPANVAAVARWRSKSRVSDRMVAMELEIAASSAPGPRSIVCVEPLDAASPFARADMVSALSLDCRRDARGGWSIAAKRINDDRSVGEPLGSIRV